MFFKDKPIITWKKVLCPFCSEPTGPKSNCHQMKPAKDVPIYKRNVTGTNSPIIPVFSENCAFRQENLWSAETNYPVSKPLIYALKTIKGINKIQPTKAYGFQISINNLYDDLEVRFELNRIYESFIHKLQTFEAKDNISKYIGIEMPNGNQFLLDNNLSEDEKEEQLQHILGLNALFVDSKLLEKEE